MKQSEQVFNRLFLLFTLCYATFVNGSNAQSCLASSESITAKYWQYRENFNKHFILVDRGPSGCVNDGIGQIGSTCEFLKTGYSLPATSINLAPSGAHENGLKDRNDSGVWYDPGCGDENPNDNVDGTHWNIKQILISDPNALVKHNYLDVGSETPHQMGWYWATLATEYELLKRGGQHQEAQKTLEELFLGLQAYRRLDMQAQCMARKRYDEITEDFEVETCSSWPNPHLHVVGDCLCGSKYTESGHPNFDNPCEDNCDYQPDLSGYSGFFLREDATQALEVLHDPSEDKYNIDLVSSAYALSLTPPCDSAFSQPCYLVHKQNFMSQDGMTGLMIGLALIKRYIPASAEVITCDSAKHKPFEMAQKIAEAIVDRADDTYRNRISWPGSPGCCAKETFLSNSEGGQLMATIHGFKHAADYIDGQNRHSSAEEWFHWSVTLRGQVQTSDNTNAKFWLRLKAIGWDMGEERHATKTLFHSAAETQNVEILILLNNLLHPGGENLSTNQAFFEELLCKAPCGGPCRKKDDYAAVDPEIWPEFDCPNEPEWIGQRWETHSYGDANRLFNGLDYMALHNIYMLHYNLLPQGYQNPSNLQPNSYINAGYIDGPNALCPVNTGHYEITPTFPSSTISNVVWETSTNLQILSAAQSEADIRANTSLVPSYIQASFNEARSIPQRYPAPAGPPPFFDDLMILMPNGQFIDDNCYFVYRKPITTTPEPAHPYQSRVDHCNKTYEFHTAGLTTLGGQIHWKFEVLGSNPPIVRTAEGPSVYFNGPDIFPVVQGGLRVTLKIDVQGECGESEETYIEYLSYCGGMRVVANPNPAHNEIAVSLVQNDDNSLFASTDPTGVRIRINPLNGGSIVTDTHIYANGQSINVSSLQNGLYNIEATASDLPVPVNSVLVIAR